MFYTNIMHEYMHFWEIVPRCISELTLPSHKNVKLS